MSTKISALPPSAGLVLTDIFAVVDDPGGTPVTQKADLSQLQTLFSSGSGSFVLKAGDTMTGALAIGNGVLVASAPVLSLSQTWNNAAVTFTNLFSNVTNTASGANSNLFNYQVDGVDRFNFTVGGTLRAILQNASDSGVSFFLRKRGNAGDITGAVAANSSLGGIFFSGWDGAAFQTGGQINTTVEGAWTGANRGLSIAFQVTPSGSISALTALNLTGGVNGIVFGISHRQPIVDKAAAYTITNLDHTINCTSGTFTVTLPTAVGIPGRIHVIKNSGVGTITIDPDGAELIDSLATATLVSGASITTQSTGTGWIII